MRKSNKQQRTTKGFPSIKRLALQNVTFPSVIRGMIQDVKVANTTSAATSFFLNYPTYYRDANTGSITQMVTVPSLLANEQKVFDEYKTVSLKLIYVPYTSGTMFLSSYTTASGNSGVTNVTATIDPTIITGIDLDDGALFTSASKALNSQGAAVKSRYGTQPLTLAVCKQVDKVEKMKWLNLGAIIPNVSTPPDPNNPAKLASIKTWTAITGGSAYPVANTAMGMFIAEWSVYFKGVYTIS